MVHCITIPVGGYFCTLTSSSSYGNYIVAFIYDCTRFSDASGGSVSYSYPIHVHRVRRDHFFAHYFNDEDMSCVYVGVSVESWFMDDSDSHSWNHCCNPYWMILIPIPGIATMYWILSVD